MEDEFSLYDALVHLGTCLDKLGIQKRPDLTFDFDDYFQQFPGHPIIAGFMFTYRPVTAPQRLDALVDQEIGCA